MKVKLGDITIRQMNILCSMNENCNACPLCSQVKGGLHFDCNPYASVKKDYDREIDLPDEENKKGELYPYPNCHYKNDHDRCIGCESRHKETDKFDSIVNDLKNGVQPQIGTNSKLPEGWREV